MSPNKHSSVATYLLGSQNFAPGLTIHPLKGPKLRWIWQFPRDNYSHLVLYLLARWASIASYLLSSVFKHRVTVPSHTAGWLLLLYCRGALNGVKGKIYGTLLEEEEEIIISNTFHNKRNREMSERTRAVESLSKWIGNYPKSLRKHLIANWISDRIGSDGPGKEDGRVLCTMFPSIDSELIRIGFL